MENHTFEKMLLETIVTAMEEIANAFFHPDFFMSPVASVLPGEEDPHQSAGHGITAIVGFSGAITGGLHLSSGPRAAMSMAGAFTDGILNESDFSDLTAVVKDSVGEIANMLTGAVKSNFRHLSEHAIHLTPPIVIWGKDYQMDYTGSEALKSVTQYFDVHAGRLSVTVFWMA